MEFKSYQEFWPFYLQQHSKPATRAWHFVGTSFVFVCIGVVLLTMNFWYLLAAPIIAYSFAWISHFFIEGNKPATFGHPFWSLRADFQMFGSILTGNIGKELEKHVKKEKTAS
ncbi:Mpo1-like protein [Pseudalkalibacillus sp. Hm43]|uniref:Mpo1-like protein n=1 Tax=Pseudalkalibacillus sp. Hm43 TaxID=3450742 RepID=UPI003F438D2F